MRLFQCDECGQSVYFENNVCLKCQQRLAFDPDALRMTTIVAVDEAANLWQSAADGAQFRRCDNDLKHNVCNWLIPAQSDQSLCFACQFTEMIPNLADPANQAHWSKLETAKRRLLYTLLSLGLPTISKVTDPEIGLSFQFLADGPQSNQKVLTGHADGLITLNIAEADDAERERRRLAMGEPYRTLLGHFRHETGHYYWDRLIRDTSHLTGFREMFGDESADYGQALKDHYASGPVPNWQQQYVSSYAASHPWEDWAETWAHYLHMVDALEMASSSHVSVPDLENQAAQVQPHFSPQAAGQTSMDQMINDWLSLAHLLNCASRCLGQADSYPFVLSQPVIEKLNWIHELVTQAENHQSTSPSTEVGA